MTIFGLIGLKAGTNNIGDVDVASIAAGDNNIGNVDVVTLPAITGAISLIPNTGSGSFSGAYTAAQADVEMIAAPGAGLSIYITDIIPSNGATAGNIAVEEDTASAKTRLYGPIYCGINGGASSSFHGVIKCTANKNVGLKSVDVTTHSVTVLYFVAA